MQTCYKPDIMVEPIYDIEIQGIVLDEDNIPLPGAHLFLQSNSSIGTVTNFDGEFSLTVPQGELINISFMGYTTQTIAATDRYHRIIMKMSADFLDEVIITGTNNNNQPPEQEDSPQENIIPVQANIPNPPVENKNNWWMVLVGALVVGMALSSSKEDSTSTKVTV